MADHIISINDPLENTSFVLSVPKMRQSHMTDSQMSEVGRSEIEDELRNSLLEIQTLNEQNISLKKIIETLQLSLSEQSPLKKIDDYIKQITSIKIERDGLAQKSTLLIQERDLLEEENRKYAKVIACKEMWLYFYRRDSKNLQDLQSEDQSLFDESVWKNRVDDLMGEIQTLQQQSIALQDKLQETNKILDQAKVDLQTKNMEVEMWKMNVSVLEKTAFQKKK